MSEMGNSLKVTNLVTLVYTTTLVTFALPRQIQHPILSALM